MTNLIAEGFSLSHAAILDGSTGAEHVDGDIYGVNEASLDPDTDSYDNEGDDTILSSWNWLNFAEVSVQGGYVPFKLIALLTGETISSSGTGANERVEILLWTDRSMNVAPKPMLIRIPSKNDLGTTRTLEFVLFKVQFAPITFEGPTYKDGLKINYGGKALMSVNDEKGALLSAGFPVPVGTKAVGRLLSRA
jgi:hypothetical protein